MKCSVCVVFSLLLITNVSMGQAAKTVYGNNPAAGKYLQCDDAKIYYEVYGDGDPLLLLHGGYYGYIDEYEQYFPDLIKNFKVIAVATRGHGKSEIGTRDYSYQLFAEDALKILAHEGHDSAAVLGFSDGAITGLIIAAKYPSSVKRLVSMGGLLGIQGYRPESLQQIWAMDGKKELEIISPFLEERRKLMPEPDRFPEWVDKLKAAWLQPVWLTKQEVSAIQCPTLLVGADKDPYVAPDAIVDSYHQIPNAQLLILPNSGHVSMILNPNMLREYIIPFLIN